MTTGEKGQGREEVPHRIIKCAGMPEVLQTDIPEEIEARRSKYIEKDVKAKRCHTKFVLGGDRTLS